MFKLLQLTTYGIKSIEKPITINFSNATIEKGLKKVNNVKGIYGYNGAGKSALVEAVNLYKSIAINPDYLQDSSVKSRLSNLVNFKTGEFYVSMVFALDDIAFIYKHELKIKKDSVRKGFIIEEERLSKWSKRTINDEFELIVEKNRMDLQVGENLAKDLPEYISGESLRYTSIIAAVQAHVTENEGEARTSFELEAGCVLAFALDVHCCLSDSGRYDYVFVTDVYDEGVNYLYERASFFDYSKSGHEEENGQKIIVDKKDFEYFKAENRKLEKFIKIFKPSVKSIGLKVEENRGVFEVRRYFVYKDYNIDLRYESSGIRQLVHLFPCLSMCARGSIIFIDEIDTNINSVYLEKLVSFFLEYGKGQMVFTTHNIETMDVLKNQRRAIEVLGSDGQLDIWVKKGNRSPKSDYIYGNFPNSPMNVEDFDFISVFQGEEE